MTPAPTSAWRQIVQLLRAEPPGVTLRLPKSHLPHPRTFRMTASIGLPEGQSADYRKTLRDGAGLHVRDFGQHYEIHLEAARPGAAMRRRGRDQTRGGVIAGGTALGALVGSALGSSKDGVLAGAALGGLIAALLDERKTRLPRAS